MPWIASGARAFDTVVRDDGDRVNIVLFVTDDHAPWTLTAYGNTEARSPTFDRMARDGAVFRQAFTPTPVCSPARACLLTGLPSSQHGIHDFIYDADPECGDRDWLAGQVTLAELLHGQGYYCGLSGKWHVGQPGRWPRGYDWSRIARNSRHIGPVDFCIEGEWVQREGNKTALITDYAVEFLDSVPRDQSFFLQVGYVATHSPYTGQDPDLVASYLGATFRDIQQDDPHPWSWNEGFPEHTAPSADEARQIHANQYAAVTDIDRNIARILDALQATGRAQRTVVIYTSDHGLSLGQRGFWGKGNGTRPLNMYEVSIQVPLIVVGPQVCSGIEVDRCVDHFDTFQTICDLGGVERSAFRKGVSYPGKSFRSLLVMETPDHWDDTRYGEYGDLRMIRTPEYKLVRRYPAGPDDLFDLKSDPTEQVNLAARPDMSKIRDHLLRRLEAFYARHEDPRKSGLLAKELPRHNTPKKPSQVISSEAWRDGIRESRGLQGSPE